jgi:hypothetical protein
LSPARLTRPFKLDFILIPRDCGLAPSCISCANIASKGRRFRSGRQVTGFTAARLGISLARAAAAAETRSGGASTPGGEPSD